MKILSLVVFVLLSPCLITGAMITGVFLSEKAAKFDFFPEAHVRMEAAFDHEFESFAEEREDFGSFIYCRWTNVGKAQVALLLKDHDDYHGTLDYPWGIQVRVVGEGGKVVTENSTIQDGWWTSSVIHSQLSEVEPGDVVLLQPGEVVVRLVPLAEVLAGIDLGASERRLPAGGEFSIELRLGDIHAARSLDLRVVEKARE